MIITTIEELRLHLPNHAYDDIENMAGAFRRSESDVLKEKIGHALYTSMIRRYYAVSQEERRDWLVGENGFGEDPWGELTYLCQQVVVFDSFCRSADINAVSVNQSGINVVDAENYDTASKDFIAAYKRQLNQETHAAVNRLLVWLEEKAQAVGDREESTEDNSGFESSSSSDEEPEEFQELKEIVRLWQSSKYYYRHADLFVGTASLFNKYVDIYDSRERFVELLPDLQYCQGQFIENELGEPLTADLLSKKMSGRGNASEKRVIQLAQQALCLCVETRSKMFSRKESKDEAFGAVARMVGYVRQHIEDFDSEAAQYFPQYHEAMVILNAKHCACSCPKPQPPRWENNRPSNGMLVMPEVY